MFILLYSHFYRLLVSASQDGKLIIWDSYTTNKVSHVVAGINVMVVSVTDWSLLLATFKSSNVCCIFKLEASRAFFVPCMLWFKTLKGYVRIRWSHLTPPILHSIGIHSEGLQVSWEMHLLRLLQGWCAWCAVSGMGGSDSDFACLIWPSPF